MLTPKRIHWLSIAAGVLGAGALTLVYLGIVSLAGGLTHALDLLWEDRWWVLPILVGFGTQMALYTRLRLLARHARAEGAMTAAGGGLSTVGMIACCAHHIADLLPIIGLSAAATLLANWKIPFLILGLGTNLAGIVLSLRALRRFALGGAAVRAEATS